MLDNPNLKRCLDRDGIARGSHAKRGPTLLSAPTAPVGIIEAFFRSPEGGVPPLCGPSAAPQAVELTCPGRALRLRQLHVCACRIGHRQPFSGVRLRARPGSLGPKTGGPGSALCLTPPLRAPGSDHPARQHHPERSCALTACPDPHRTEARASHRLAAPPGTCTPHLACLPIIVRPSEPFRSPHPRIRIAASERLGHPFRPVHNTGLHPLQKLLPAPAPGDLSSLPTSALHHCNTLVLFAFWSLSVCPSDLFKVSRHPSRSQQNRAIYPQTTWVRCG